MPQDKRESGRLDKIKRIGSAVLAIQFLMPQKYENFDDVLLVME